MNSSFDVDDVILNFDPASPHARFQATTMAEPSEALPRPIPWPEGTAPTPAPLHASPDEADDLTRFHGYDAVVVTWTAAEATALATLFTPEFPTSAWYEYRHDVESYIPLVTGVKAPFNSNGAEMARYRHSLGLYFPCKIGDARVLLFKSGLHLDYDGPATPVRRLMEEIAQAIKPRLFITTGTAGAIGSDVRLGDVVIAAKARFDCRSQFSREQWANSSYQAAVLPEGALAAITPALTSVNAAPIVGARSSPQVFATSFTTVVTTDFFAFDDSTNHYELNGLGLACEMGDAMVAYALQSMPDIRWYSIRNASDPQIPNPTNQIEQAKHVAASIYMKYGALTTAASAIATWAVIHAGANR
ncbi:hypothetical protein C2L64_47185 [Paraburkholderia hospita]|uniref:Nucleoside phosphorylase domain-containing protein n=1 Tax=Paraburkholderia hospita TaxID=169430 RepID=A0AAN1JKU8_9BURK|nr:hypothetical protein [Paraburkholderia hospita]AUT75867.1 hypothetical protein C2L64_47185 [Paraburkholderia hospita]